MNTTKLGHMTLHCGRLRHVNRRAHHRTWQGDKKRVVFVGKPTKRALQAYLRARKDNREYLPLFATRDVERFTVQAY